MTQFQSGGRGGGVALRIDLEGVDESLAVLTRAGAELRGLDRGRVMETNRALRRRARALAEWLARTTITPMVMGGPAPQALAMSRTIRAKTDRMPMVVVGKTMPRSLSGWTGGGDTVRWRGSLAWGIERGPAGPTNHYTLARRETGYVLGPGMEVITRRAVGPYREIVALALAEAGVTNLREP